MKENPYLLRLKALVLKELEGVAVKVVIFGSWARHEASRSSDVDIGIIPSRRFEKPALWRLKEKVENANIPYKVDIVNLNDTSKAFKTEALRKAIVWRKK